MNKKHHKEVIVLLGKPGSGKGTQAEPLANALGIPFVSVGKMLRAEIKKGTVMGKKAAADVAAGRLVPNSISMFLLRRRLMMKDAENGIGPSPPGVAGLAQCRIRAGSSGVGRKSVVGFRRVTVRRARGMAGAAVAGLSFECNGVVTTAAPGVMQKRYDLMRSLSEA